MHRLDHELFVFDLDGTLLNSEKELTQNTLESIEMLKRLGIGVVICTGRSFLSFKPFMGILKPQLPVILQNGALIISPDERILRQSILDRNIAEELLSYIGVEDVILFRFSSIPPDRFAHSFSKNNPFSKYINSTKDLIMLVENFDEVFNTNSEYVELGVFRKKGEESELMRIIENLNSVYTKKDVSIIVSNFLEDTGFFEIFGPEVSKGNAMRFLEAYLGVKLEKMVFFGDNYNDVDAMKIVGLSVAMGNAPYEVKKAADFVAPANDEEGVYKFVKEFLKI